jgi:hypothetical protein
MKTVVGRVIETLTVVKDVEVEVPDNASEQEIKDALRDKAYEKLVSDGTGWEGVWSDGVEVEVID